MPECEPALESVDRGRLRRRRRAAALAVVALLSAVLLFPTKEGDVSYGRAGRQVLLLDVYRPRTPGPHPAVVLIHGGGWSGGDKSGYRGLGRLLALCGYVTFSINYRVAPEHPYPAALDDCQRAVRWIRANSAAYDIDPNRIGAVGHSSGGHLAALLGVRDTRANGEADLARYSSRAQAVVSIYGAYDLEQLWSRTPALRKTLAGWLGGAPDRRSSEYRDASPRLLVDSRSSPFLMVHGSRDRVMPVEQARVMHQALRAAGVESRLLVLPGQAHGWATLSPSGWSTYAALLGFFRDRLRP